MNRTYTPRVSESAPSDAVRARADAVRALAQHTASLADQYGANTGPVEPTSIGAVGPRTTLYGPKIDGSSTCSSFTHGLYGPIRVQQSSKNLTNPQHGHLPSLIRVFAMRLTGKQGHKASSYETAESNQTELGAHAISVLSWTLVHISQLLCIFITIICFHDLK